MLAGVIASERIRAVAGTGVPGVVVMVAGPEGVRAGGACGLADITGRVPASPGMVCPWFSMTKIVTATAAMRLAERGVLDLDAPVAEQVLALRQVRPPGWATRITARHLLSHSAGLANPIRHRPALGALISEVEEFRRVLTSSTTAPNGTLPLTPAELRLLPYLQTHLTAGKIAERLAISGHTVNAETQTIYRKFGVSSCNDAVQKATALGLLGA